MRRRICQRLNDLEEFDHRTGPAVSNNDRQRVRMTRTDVQEMDIDAVDLCAILTKAVQHRLAATPVITRPPILQKRPELGEWNALRPIIYRLTLRETSTYQTLPQIFELAFGRGICEWRDGGSCLRECVPYPHQAGRGHYSCDACSQHGAAR